jgi:tetraacyldisaccharide-1-P 4'-kinase
VTHCTEDCTKEAQGELKKRIAHFTKAPVFFSRIRSNGLEDANGGVKAEGGKALLLAGIAKPASFSEHMKRQCPEIEFEDLFFSDHHRFSKKDIRSITEAANRNGSRIITTEKDYARLPRELIEHPSLAICYESIEVELLEGQVLFEKILNDKLRFSQAV